MTTATATATPVLVADRVRRRTGQGQTAVAFFIGVRGLGKASATREAVVVESPSALAMPVGDPAWAHDMSQTLDELATLPDDWDGYGTPGPTQAAIQIGRELLEALKRVGPRPSHLGPSAIGGISYAFISGRDIASLEVSNEGAVSAALIPRADPPKVWDVDWPADRERTLFGIHDGLYGQERIP